MGSKELSNRTSINLKEFVEFAEETNSQVEVFVCKDGHIIYSCGTFEKLSTGERDPALEEIQRDLRVLREKGTPIHIRYLK